MAWTLRLQVYLYVKGKTNLARTLAIDFSGAETDEGLKEDAEDIIKRRHDYIVDSTFEMRARMGVSLPDIPYEVYYGIEVRMPDQPKRMIKGMVDVRDYHY